MTESLSERHNGKESFRCRLAAGAAESNNSFNLWCWRRAALSRAVLAIVVALALVGRVAAHAEEPPSFVGAPACVGCHTAEFDAWRGSHNALAMQPASAATVLGDFARAQFEHFGSRLPSFVTARNS
jgi:hypothetical protein